MNHKKKQTNNVNILQWLIWIYPQCSSGPAILAETDGKWDHNTTHTHSIISTQQPAFRVYYGRNNQTVVVVYRDTIIEWKYVYIHIFRICAIAFLTFSTFPSSPARTHTFPLFCELSLPEGCCIYMLHARWVGWMISWHSLALRVVFWLTQCEPWGSEQCECKNNRIGFVYSVID